MTSARSRSACRFVARWREAVAHDLARCSGGEPEGGTQDEFFPPALRRAKHLEFFDRWFDEVVGGEVDLASFLGEARRSLSGFAGTNRLLIDHSPPAQVEARWSIT
jgi:hypothetical protein